MKNINKKSAFFLIALLLIANFSLAVILSEYVIGKSFAGETERNVPIVSADLAKGEVAGQIRETVALSREDLESAKAAMKEESKSFLGKAFHILDKTFNFISLGKALITTIQLYREFGIGFPEQQLSGVAYCEKCNDDPFIQCTEDRCKMLGNCISGNFKNEKGERVITCVPGECNEQGLVKVDEIEAKWKGKSEKGTNKLEIGKTFDYDTVNISLIITTDIHSMCRYGIDGEGKDREYKDMNPFNKMIWSKNHNASIGLPDEIIRGQKHKIYIKCESICGQIHEKEFKDYFVEFEFEKLPDKLPPSVSYIDPDENYFYSSEIKDVDITVSLSENGKCKYSTKLDNYTVDFADMHDSTCNNNKACITRPSENKCSECSFTLDLSSGFEEIDWGSADYSRLKIADEIQAQMELTGKSKIYFINLRCEDLDKNLMDEAYEYAFKTADPYNLEITEPLGEVEERFIPLTVNTSRSTKCRFSLDKELSFQDMSDIDNIFEVSHKVEILNLSGGQHTVYVKCLDSVNLMKSSLKAFKVRGDTLPPKIIRAYHTAGFEPLLTIKTDEYSACRYSTDKSRGCNFDFDGGEEQGIFGMMSVGKEGKEHTALWDSSRTYYMKCKDWKEILPSKGKCSDNGIIQPYSLANKDSY